MPTRAVPQSLWNAFQSDSLQSGMSGLIDSLQRTLADATAPITMPAPPVAESTLPVLPSLDDLTKHWGADAEQQQQQPPTKADTAQPSGLSLPSLDDLTSAWTRPSEQQRSTKPPAASGQAQAMPANASFSPGPRTGDPSGGVEQWDDKIQAAARKYNVPVPVIKGIMHIESGGNPNAVSAAGALGLLQVMPFHYGAGENGLDPDTSIDRGTKILADNFARYGDWDRAAAAYFGAIDANGNITDASDGNTTGSNYVRLFRDAASRYAGSAVSPIPNDQPAPPLTRNDPRTDRAPDAPAAPLQRGDARAQPLAGASDMVTLRHKVTGAVSTLPRDQLQFVGNLDDFEILPDAMPKVGADVPVSSMSAGDQKRAKLAAAQGRIVTQDPDNPQPMPGNVYTGGVGPEGMNPGGFSDSGDAVPGTFPVDRNRPFLPDREGIDRTNDLLQPRDAQGNPLPPGPVPPNRGQVEYDDQGNPHWVGDTNYQDYERERQTGAMYRQPLGPPTDPEASTGAAPSTYNDPTTDGTQQQPLPDAALPFDPREQDAGPREAAPPDLSQTQPAQYGSSGDDPGTAPLPFDAAPDITYLPSTAPLASDQTNMVETPVTRPQQPVPASYGASADDPGQAPTPPRVEQAGMPPPGFPGLQAVYDSAGNFLHWIQGAATDVTNQISQNVAGNRQAVEDANAGQSGGVNFGQGVQNLVNALPEPAVGGMLDTERRIRQIQDAAAAAQGITDPVRAMRAADDPTWRAQNPDLAQEYDDLQNEAMLTVGGMVGSGGEAFSSKGPQTVEALQQRVEQANSIVQRLLHSGDAKRLAMAQENRAALESALIDAQNARRALEPRIRSEVGVPEQTLPPSEMTVENRMDAVMPPADAPMRPEDLSGPVSIPTDTGSRLNVGFGAVPDEGPRATFHAPDGQPSQIRREAWQLTPEEWQAEMARVSPDGTMPDPSADRAAYQRWYELTGNKPAELTPSAQPGPFETDSRLRPAIESSYLRPDDYRFVSRIDVDTTGRIAKETNALGAAGIGRPSLGSAVRARHLADGTIEFRPDILRDAGAGRTITHEVGHSIQNNLPESLQERWLSEIHPRLKDFDYGRYLETAPERPPTSYAHESPAEDFAETFTEWRQAQAEGRRPNLGPLRQQFMQDVDAWLSGGMRGAPEGQQLQLLSSMGTGPRSARRDVWQRPDRFAAVNRVLGQGLASTFSGGMSAAAADQLGDPNDPNRQAKAFVAGAVAPYLGQKAVRAGLRVAGKLGAAGEREGGALATLGNVPPSKVNQQILPGMHPLRQPPPAPIGQVAQQFQLPPPVQRAVQAAQRQQRPGVSPLEWWRRFAGEIGYSSMIGPATFTVNLTGNVLEPLWSIPKEATRAVSRGNPREFGEMAGGAFNGMREVGSAILDALTASGRYAATPGHEPLSAVTNNPIGRAVTTGLEVGGRVFSAVPDAIFGTIAQGAGEARTAAQIATDAGLKGTAWKQHVNDLLTDAKAVKAGQLPTLADTQRVIDEGAAYAKRQTFQEPLGSIGKNVRDFATIAVVPDGKGGRKPVPVLGNLLTPFFNTPWNMALRQAERSPLGLAMNSQGSRFDKLYDATLGSALLIGVAAGPVASGMITGGGPDDPQKKSEMRSQGWRPYSTLIDGVYVPNRVFGIYAPLLNAAADVHDAIAYSKDKTPGSLASTYAGRLGQQLQQQPYLQGISNLMQAIQANQGGGLGSAAERYAASTITRMVPYAATARTIGTALDPSERTTDQGKNVPADTTVSQLVQGGVGLRSGLPVAQDVLGRPQANPQQGLSALFAKTSSQKPDPTVKAFLDAGVDIGFPKSTLTIDAIPIDLTRDETRRWNTYRGQILERFAPGLTQRAFWTNPEARQAAMQDLLRQANEAADQRLMQSMGAADIRRRVLESRQKQRAAVRQGAP